MRVILSTLGVEQYIVMDGVSCLHSVVPVYGAAMHKAFAKPKRSDASRLPFEARYSFLPFRGIQARGLPLIRGVDRVSLAPMFETASSERAGLATGLVVVRWIPLLPPGHA